MKAPYEPSKRFPARGCSLPFSRSGMGQVQAIPVSKGLRSIPITYSFMATYKGELNGKEHGNQNWGYIGVDGDYVTKYPQFSGEEVQKQSNPDSAMLEAL